MTSTYWLGFKDYRINGTQRSDYLMDTGALEPSVITARGGADTIILTGGDDFVFAGRGSDTIEMREGGDAYIEGGRGVDFLVIHATTFSEVPVRLDKHDTIEIGGHVIETHGVEWLRGGHAEPMDM